MYFPKYCYYAYTQSYMQTVQISYASEKNKAGKKDYDPVKESYFYTKEEPWKPISGNDLVSYNA